MLCRSSSLANSLLSIDGYTVSCSDHVKFDELFNFAYKEMHGNRIRSLNRAFTKIKSKNRRKHIRSRLQAARRMEAIFWPKGKRLIVSGIVIESEDAEEVVATTQGEMQDALSSYWDKYMRLKSAILRKRNNC